MRRNTFEPNPASILGCHATTANGDHCLRRGTWRMVTPTDAFLPLCGQHVAQAKRGNLIPWSGDFRRAR